ncbi:TolC family protein [Bdellovibrio sp. 22V]|uniref:TolC family protein n=1 Tax=Bdellovibrio TaxID=958 RepID=UPI0025427701|nr:TolC family protein [Bdellovibrio sp. 22V]WII73302.1 TolC family protein [Bdellovibrio sp. 22V]
MKQIIYLFGSLLFALSASANESVSFEQIAERVRSKNPLVESLEGKKNAKKSREGHLGRSFIPDINAEYAQETFKVGNEEQKTQPHWRAEATLNLFRGGADSQEEASRELETKAAEYETKLSLQEEIQKAYDLYWNLLFQQERLKILNDDLKLTQQNLQEASRRVSAGVATATDRLEFEMRISVIKQEISLTEKDIRQNSKSLALSLGAKSPVIAQGSLHHFHEWEQNLKPISSERLPEVNLLNTEKEVLKSKKSQYKSDYFPAIDAYAGLAENNQRDERDFADASDRRETYMGLRASWSLGKTVSSFVERSSLQKELASKELALNYARQKTELDQTNKIDELRTLHSFVHDTEENIKSASRYLDATRKEYARGVKNSPDMLEATEKYINAKLRLSEIVRDFNKLYSSQLLLSEL